jgi:hypothetical protein
MMPAAAVVACALALLGRSQTVAPVHFVATPPRHASPNVEAFVTAGEHTIFLVTSSAAFRDAQADPWTALHHEGCRKIAAILVHEEWHLRHGQDERGAYTVQLTTLQLLGARPETINAVRAAMGTVLSKQADDADRVAVASYRAGGAHSP